MAFNFGAFVGGFGTRVSENIETAKEDQRQQDFRLEMLAEEEATKQRLQAAADRKAQRAADKKLAGSLEALNFDKGRISFIMSRGAGYAEQMVAYAQTALANGYDPNTILKYTPELESSKLFVGPPGERRLDFTQAQLKDMDYTTAFEQDRDVVTTILTPKPKEFDTLKKMRASVVQKLMTMEPSTDPDSDYMTLAEQNEFLLQEIGKVAKTEADAARDPDTSKDVMSNADAIRDIKFYKDTVASTYNLTSLEGTYQDITAGAQGKAQVARIDAALTYQDRINNVGGSKNGQGVIDAELTSAVSALRSIATQTAEAYSSDKAGELGADADLGTKFKMPEGKDNYSLGELFQMDGLKPSGISYGDVIVINGKLAIYTGMAHTYGNAARSTEDPLVLPYVFANKNNDPMWLVTKTGR